MEIMLAIVVVASVFFFGALISMGNERQRRAIDNLREQIVLWAIQDLKVKREHLARTVQITDPLGWLNKTASKALGFDLKLQILETFEEPNSLICKSGDGGAKVIFSPLSPTDLRRIKSGKLPRLSRFVGHNPLLFLPRKVNIYELSILDGSFLFDLELSLAWKDLTGQTLESSNRLWLYMYA